MTPSRVSVGERIAPLEGLRGLAALSIVIFHVALFTGHTVHTLPGLGLAQLKAGVALFFVISGLVLYRPYARRIRRAETLPSVKYFMRRRVVRILPAYWVVLTVWLITNVLAGHSRQVFGADPWTDYGLLQTYSARTFAAGLGVSWSLCVELAFYLVLPALAFGFGRLTGAERLGGRWSAAGVQLTGLAALAAISFDLRLGLTSSWLPSVGSGGLVLAGSLPWLFDWFAIGMALAVLAAEWEEGEARFSALVWLARRPVFCWLLAGYLFVVSVLTQGSGQLVVLEGAAAHLAVGLACAILILPGLIPSAIQRTSRALRLLASPLCTWLGTISYGIYLVHLPVLLGLRALFLRVPALPQVTVPAGLAPTLGLLLTTLLAAVGLGAASWYLIERPALRRWASKTSHQPAVGRPGLPVDLAS